MDKLTNFNKNDLESGVLQRMLANVGIDNIQEYVKEFHHETEELVVEEYEHTDPNQSNNDEQIVPPTDIQRWITGLRPRFDDPLEPAPVKEQQPPPPADLKSWMQRMAPVHLSADSIATEEPSDSNSNQNAPVSGDLGNWLTDWSKSIGQQPPPASMDHWLKNLIPNDLHEPMSKANTPKGRLNSYLNAAEKVLAHHGYQTSTEIAPTAGVKTKVGVFGNVKQMYFLWKVLDKNGDRKITVEDVQILMQEMGLGFISKYLATAIFQMVDSNHDGKLDFRDFVVLMSILKQLVSAVGSAKTNA